MKNIIAVILVFALLLSFAACRRLDSGKVIIEEKSYIVDAEGVTHDIISDGNVYYYYDADGNRVEAEKKDVIVETHTVVVTESATFSPEAQSFVDSFGGDFENAIQADETEPQLEIDEIIPEDAFNEIEVEIGSDGKPEHEEEYISYEEILESDKFTMSVNVKATTGGQTQTVPITVMRNGEELYFETAFPVNEGGGSTRLNFLLLKDGCYIVVPSMRAYMEIPKETVGEMIPTDSFANMDEVEGTYVSTAEVEYNGQKYICDVYDNEGATIKYYYQNGNLKRVETVKGEDSSVMEFVAISKDVDKSKFKVPKNYFDLSEMAGSEFDPSLLG